MKTLHNTYRLILASWREGRKDQISYFAGALAFYTIFSLPAFFYAVIMLAGFFLQGELVRNQILMYVTDYLGSTTAVYFDRLLLDIAASTGQSIVYSVIGIFILLYAATNLFTHVQGALSYIFRIRDNESGAVQVIVRHRARSFVFIVISTLILVLTVFLNIFVATFINTTKNVVGSGLSDYVISFFNFSIVFIIVALIFSSIYRYLSVSKVRWQGSFAGGALASLLFIIMNFILSLYFAYSGDVLFHGVAGSVLLTLLWVYYVSYVFLFGAEVARVFQRHTFVAKE